MTNQLFEIFHKELVSAQKDRDFFPIHDLNTPYWNTWEMMRMWRLVNIYRAETDAPLVPWEDIRQAEGQASGHSDYTKKFALYCSILAMEEA